MVETQDEADDTAFGDTRDVMDVVDAKAHDGGTKQDDEHSLGKFTWVQTGDAHARTVTLRRGVFAIDRCHVLVLRILARHGYHVSQVISCISSLAEDYGGGKPSTRGVVTRSRRLQKHLHKWAAILPRAPPLPRARSSPVGQAPGGAPPESRVEPQRPACPQL